MRVVPYRLPELLAELARPVVIAEGEKDCDNLARIGVLATCNAGGAGKWTAEHSAFLRGRRVIVLPDNDEAGCNHAQQVAQSLQGIAESVRIVELPGLPDKGDVSDWIEPAARKSNLERLAEAAPIWTPTARAVARNRFLRRAGPARLSNARLARRAARLGGSRIARHANAGRLGRLVGTGGLFCLLSARRVVVKPRPGWREPVNLFVAVLLEPGNRKSAVFTDAMDPLREQEAELIDAERPVVARAQSDRRQKERGCKTSKSGGREEPTRKPGTMPAIWRRN